MNRDLPITILNPGPLSLTRYKALIKASELTTELRTDFVNNTQSTVGVASKPGDYIFRSLLVSIALTAIPYGTVAPWLQAIFEIVVFALGIAWIICMLRQSDLFTGHNTLLFPWIAILLLAFVQTLPILKQTVVDDVISSTISTDPYETKRFMLKIAALIVTGYLLRSCVRGDEKRFNALIHLVIFIGLASAVFAILRQSFQGESSYFVLPLLSPGTGYGQFINHNHFAFLMEMTWGLLCGLVLGGVRKERLPYYLIAGVIVWTALVLSNSRGGLFSMLGQLCLIITVWPHLLLRKSWSNTFTATKGKAIYSASASLIARSLLMRVVLAAGLLTIIVIGAAWVGGSSLVNRFDELPRELRTSADLDPRLRSRRIEMWAATWKLIKESPLIGTGFGGFETAITKYYDASGNWTLSQAHNDYLELLASGGIIGAFFILWFVIALLQHSHKELQKTDPFRRAACRGALIGLCGIALHSLVDFGLHLTINALVCIVLIVIATAEVGKDETQARAETPALNAEFTAQAKLQLKES
ncbi:MAG TPA: O-antigen ligase family protein [Blastocatellia bacterium]|nr:O-antigen ligase family protein [Blastocatellia bacterium]